ncbi:hypothetical protein S40293_11568 [Stachybotrys chartarum IBT 40293]|nr:hypothetical protein S40293_11568 [Stachybotrys chartarum IBT 40293]
MVVALYLAQEAQDSSGQSGICGNPHATAPRQ